MSETQKTVAPIEFPGKEDEVKDKPIQWVKERKIHRIKSLGYKERETNKRKEHLADIPNPDIVKLDSKESTIYKDEKAKISQIFQKRRRHRDEDNGGHLKYQSGVLLPKKSFGNLRSFFYYLDLLFAVIIFQISQDITHRHRL